MDAGLPVELRPTRTAELPLAICPLCAAAARVIARTRLAWAAEDRAVSASSAGRPRLELKGSRALDHQPWTGD
jgi:hypothetical protein